MEKMETNKVIVTSNKPFEIYLGTVVHLFEDNDIVLVSAEGRNINLMERLVKLLTMHNWCKEESRIKENMKYKENITRMIVTLRRNDFNG